MRGYEQTATQQADFAEIDKAILEVEKRAGGLDDLEKWTTTIQNNSEKILTKLRTTRKSLERQAEILRDKLNELRHTLAGDEPTGV